MELSYLALTGALGGLISILGHAVAGSAAEIFIDRKDTALARTGLDVPDVLLHLLAGLGLGFLFWLSWGLAAVVDVPWWVRGLSFGSLCWLALALPAVVSAALTRGISVGVCAVLATRWGTTCLIAGLACAWTWQRSV